MSYFDDIYEIAADNYGLVTTAQANAVGAANKDLLRYMKRGKLERLGHGVYRVKYWISTEYDPYATAVTLVGEDAYLYGESVIALHKLAPTNPSWINVATTRRVRKRLPRPIRLFTKKVADETTMYEGIPVQTIPSAILSCAKTVMPDRLVDAAMVAEEQGLISAREKAKLLKELERI